MTYAGDVRPTEAWGMLARDANALLVDVRTRPEWTFVGVPDLTSVGKMPILLSWQVFPDMNLATDFTQRLADAVPSREAPILFLCRSGARSRAAAAAMAAQGYSRCFNVSDGFEGNLDADRHRGQAAGWKAAGLPWMQD
ncbi:rhodanese-like domain-containing protein [Rhodospirillaceae bacterium SYSU D60014]|uniref:rhodanese-like domain-containing protein n=1 Tax=Virgifigura deserti TaxID=2268457 RepID=UPI000E6707DB